MAHGKVSRVSDGHVDFKTVSLPEVPVKSGAALSTLEAAVQYSAALKLEAACAEGSTHGSIFLKAHKSHVTTTDQQEEEDKKLEKKTFENGVHHQLGAK
jgi:hypothetical protein